MGVKHWALNIAIYGKIVWCSFKSLSSVAPRVMQEVKNTHAASFL